MKLELMPSKFSLIKTAYDITQERVMTDQDCIEGNIPQEDILALMNDLGVQTITEGRRYWLVRTQGGKYFDEFILNEYIGISWNKISNSSYFKMDEKTLKDAILTLYPGESRPGLVASHILNFANGIKQGDIVLVPSYQSRRIAICEVLTSEVHFGKGTEDENHLPDLDEDSEIEDTDVPVGPCLIRKDIKILKILNRDQLGPYVSPVLYSHLTISSADNYAHHIDRMLSKLFYKDKRVHLVLQVNRKTDIPVMTLINSISDIMSACDVISTITEIPFDKNSVEIKISVQSPGPIELFTCGVIGFSLVSLLINAVVGGRSKVKLPFFEFESETKGVLERIMEFRVHNRDMKLRDLTIEEKTAIVENLKRIENACDNLEIVAEDEE